MTNTTQPKLKILFISSDKYPPYRVDVSVLFGKEIAGRGHIIDGIFQSEKPLRSACEARWSGCKVLVGPACDRSKMTGRAIDYLYGIFHDFRMFRLLKTSKYNFIIVKDKFITALTAIIASRLFGIRFIYWLSFPFPEDWLFQAKEHITQSPILYRIRGNIAKFLLYKIIFRFCDHAFVQTEKMRQNIVQKGIAKDKMTPVPMAVSIDDIPFWGHKIYGQNKERTKIVVYLGTLVKVRKMDFLLKVFRIVLSKYKNAKLYLVGGSDNSSDEQLLINEAKRLGIESAVTITGFLPQNEAWQYTRLADVCVSPIHPAPILEVGSPTKLLEYMAMGKAAVANDHPEQQMVISESWGGVCVPYQEEAFADGILYLLNNPEIAQQMGIQGRKYIEKNRNYKETANHVEGKLLELSGFLKPTSN